MRLIIRWPNWVGDAVMALPLLDQVKELTKADHLTVMARQSTAPLVADHPNLDHLIILKDDLYKIRGMRDGVKGVKEGLFDVGLILPPSFSSALIFYLGKIPKRVGSPTDSRSLLLTDTVSVPPLGVHRTQAYLNILSVFPDVTGEERQPKVNLSARDVSGAAEKLAQNGVTAGENFIAISPRAIAQSRRWGVDNYGALANRLHNETGHKIVLVGGPADQEAGASVKSSNPKQIINLCGETNLREAAGVLAGAKLFIGNDSGLAHLAGAVGCRLVVLSGADNPSETSPVASSKTVIVKKLSCIGCVKNSCPLTGDDFMRCMKLISVDEVADAARKWLQE